MKNNITELVFILDRSGSMSGLERDTIGGFNAMIEKQKRQEGECFVTTVLFDTTFQKLHDRVRIEKIKPMTLRDYMPAGCTALLDAVGGAIHHIENVHRYARPEDVPEHTIFVITTDGMENASSRWSGSEVRRMIEYERETHGWEFLFLGANIDAAETAENMGISRDRAANYRADGAGTDRMFGVLAESVSCLRFSEALPEDWAAELEEDAKRK